MATRLLTVATAALALTSLGSAQTQFFVSAPFAGNSVWSNGVEIVDVNADGIKDVVFANGSSYGGSGGSQPQRLYMGLGDGSFQPAHGNLNVPNFDAMMVIAEDFDKDGDPDLFFCADNQNQQPHLLINDGSGVFTDESALRLPSLNLRSFSLCAGDVDNDEDLDVVILDGGTFFGLQTQQLLLLNDGNGFFSNATATHAPADNYNAQDVTLFDYDGDFDIDVALSGKGANNKRSRLWVNDGTGHFTVSNVLNQVGTGQTYEIEWGDLDGDGDMDGLVQSISGLSEGTAYNNGLSAAISKSTLPSPNGDDDNEMAGIDYDNDGDLDVLVGSLGSREKLYRNNGGGSFTNVNNVIQAQGDSTMDLAVGDLNNDGRYDIVTAQGESGNFTNRIYLNQNGPADSTPPTFLGVESPAVVTSPATIFRVHLQDAIADDGHSNLSVSYDFTLEETGGQQISGNGVAFHQGGGMFRASIPVTADTEDVTVLWTATDEPGNSATATAVIGGGPPPPTCGFTAYGEGVGGANNATLSATGTPSPGATVTLNVAGYSGSGIARLIMSTGQANLPIVGGTLLIDFSSQILALTMPLSGGSASASLVVPNNPSLVGFTGYFQSASADGGAPQGWTLTNGLQVLVCP